jgi:hypothetical protein
MQDLVTRSAALRNPTPIAGLPENGDFEAPSVGQASSLSALTDGLKTHPTAQPNGTSSVLQPVPGWSDSGRMGTQLLLDTATRHGGTQSVRLSSTGPVTWLRSNVIPTPATGRLALVAWLRVADTQRQPPLRLAIEGRHDGREFYRHATVGLIQQNKKSVPLGPEWDWYLFQVPQLPEGLTDLRVRFDLMGPGEVWIDDVQLFDLVFEEVERIELARLIYVHSRKLQEGQYEDCQRFLDSYWPRFLTAHVPLVNTAPASEPRTATRTPPSPEPAAPGFWDRVKGMIPQRMRF